MRTLQNAMDNNQLAGGKTGGNVTGKKHETSAIIRGLLPPLLNWLLIKVYT